MKTIMIITKRNNGSKAHQKYIRNEHLKTFFTHFVRILILIVILAFWELATKQNWIDPFITSSPSRIIKQLKELYDTGNLFTHLFTTLNETILAFALSTIIGQKK